MASQKLEIRGKDGTFQAYISRPPAGKGPGVIVIQEIFGVNPWLRGVADHFARNGYVAVAPDLFWRFKPGLEFDAEIPDQFNQALDLYMKYSEDDGVADLASTLDFMRTMPDCQGKVGSVGFCLGGKLAYLMATRTSSDCNVSYYGVGIERNLSEGKNIKNPLMLHIAAADKFVPAEAQEEIHRALADDPQVALNVYPGMDHAFGRPGGQHYDEVAARLAESRTLEFFKKNLS